MNRSQYFGYIRVSDKKQAAGVSDEMQRYDIERFALGRGLVVGEWFNEIKTAARTGRPVFNAMMKRLKRGEAAGLIIHKIDRSARNLHDWLDIGALVDLGIDVQIAHEPVDLRTTGGRFSADILAVTAAHYIRNLKEEAIKGFDGRLKQGLYPLPAPLGYIDNGKGKPKTIDPASGPLIRRAFEQYASGRISLADLSHQLNRQGLRPKRGGKKVSAGHLAQIFRNPFYYGLIHIKRSQQTFQGIHAPLITKAIFDNVQSVFDGRRVLRKTSHEFVLRRLLRCASCHYGLTGELQKGHVYYRCHTANCVGASIREDSFLGALLAHFNQLCLDDQDVRDIRDMIGAFRRDELKDRDDVERSLRLNIENAEQRLGRLTDALVDGLLDKQSFETRKRALLERVIGLRQLLEQSTGGDCLSDSIAEFFELGITAYCQCKQPDPLQKRQTIEKLTSNLSVDGKNPVITLRSPYHEIVESTKTANCGPQRGLLRTSAKEIFEILKAAAIRDALGRP